MRPWTNAQTTACLWMLAAVIALGWIAGLVSEYQARLDYGGIQEPTKPCVSVHRGAWCP